MTMLRLSLTLALLGLLAVSATRPFAAANPSAVGFYYQRFGENDRSEANIALADFEAHLQELKSGPYQVLSLDAVVENVRARTALPDRAVTLTIDDGAPSVYSQAWPRIQNAGVPLAVFVSTDAVDRNDGSALSWEQLRELAKAGVTIGSQGAGHLRLTVLDVKEAEKDILRAQQRFTEELGTAPKYFAYPYGEGSLAIAKILNKAGIVAAFGQHSGVIHGSEDRFFLPRFGMTEGFAGLERFKMAANALPLRVADVSPADPAIRTNPPAFGFTVLHSAREAASIACYGAGGAKLRLDKLGEDRIEIRFPEPLAGPRSRINCTLPAQDGRWRWYGRQFSVRASAS